MNIWSAIMNIWLDTNDPNKVHKLWECPNDQHVWCLTCGDNQCTECGHNGPTDTDYLELAT